MIDDKGPNLCHKHTTAILRHLKIVLKYYQIKSRDFHFSPVTHLRQTPLSDRVRSCSFEWLSSDFGKTSPLVVVYKPYLSEDIKRILLYFSFRMKSESYEKR